MVSQVLQLMTALTPPDAAETRVTRIGNDILRLEVPRRARFDLWSMRTRLLRRMHPRLRVLAALLRTLLIGALAAVALSRGRALPYMTGVVLVAAPLWTLLQAVQALVRRHYRFAAVIELRPRGVLVAPENGEFELLIEGSAIVRAEVHRRLGVLQLFVAGRPTVEGPFGVPTGYLIPTGLWGEHNAAWLEAHVSGYIKDHWYSEV